MSDEQPPLRHVTIENIPAVCTLHDLAAIFDVSVRVLQKLRQQGAFPIPALPGLGRKIVRFSGQVVREYIASNGAALTRTRR